MSQYTVRTPTLPDMPDVFDVLSEYRVQQLGRGSLMDADCPSDALLTVRNQIVDVDLGARALMALVDGDLAGFCCWDWLDPKTRAAKTVLICVRRSHRGSGIGTRLQRARMQAMWEAGAQSIHTWSDDPAAIAWYERHFGYTRVGEEPIRHALHRFHLESHVWWAVHRGFPERDSLTHLVSRQPALVRE